MIIRCFALYLMVVLLSSCASVDTIKSEPLSTGQSVTVNINLDTATKIVKDFAKKRGLTLEEASLNNANSHVLIYSASLSLVDDGFMSGINYGEWMKVTFVAEGKEHTSVTVNEMNKVSFNLVGKQRHAEAIINKLRMESVKVSEVTSSNKRIQLTR